MTSLSENMNLFGFEIKVVFLVSDEEILAYSWHYTEDKARRHMEKIVDFHGLKGEMKMSSRLEKWLERKIKKVVIEGKRFTLPDFEYKNRKVYEKIMDIPKGSTTTYSQIAKIARVKYTNLLITLMRNPFQVLIPCHRLLTKSGSLMGFYPLGKEVKRKLLEIEGLKCHVDI